MMGKGVDYGFEFITGKKNLVKTVESEGLQ